MPVLLLFHGRPKKTSIIKKKYFVEHKSFGALHVLELNISDFFLFLSSADLYKKSVKT